jgi:hypothetical protein
VLGGDDDTVVRPQAEKSFRKIKYQDVRSKERIGSGRACPLDATLNRRGASDRYSLLSWQQ